MQTFTYAFTAWEGSFADCDVVRQGYELNVTPPVTAGSVNRFSGLNIDRANVILDTMKPAEDGSGDVILRLYEAKKAATDAEISFGFDVSGASACDMLENVTEELKVVDGKLKLSFRAFEIKTIRVKR